MYLMKGAQMELKDTKGSGYLFVSSFGYEKVEKMVEEAINKLATVIAEASLAHESGLVSDEVYRKSLGGGLVSEAYKKLKESAYSLMCVSESGYHTYKKINGETEYSYGCDE